MTDVLNMGIVYICVPTKSNEDGTCDISIVEDSVEWLVQAYSWSETQLLRVRFRK